VRSAAAINKLAEAGFTKVYNIVDGFEGDKEKDKNSPNVGKRTVDGWRNAGTPWTYDMDAALVFAEKK
jgi:rhodanese-related sulfurtransferase